MLPRRLTKSLSVAPQITPEDVPEIAAQGYASILCNRPDGEAADQTPFDEIAEKAKAINLEIAYVPVQSGFITDDDVAAFKATLDALPKPVLAYCRSGTRCAALWALSENDLSLDETLSVAHNAGYDLSGLAPRIAQRTS
jgi:sulfide:quinone oxidoreductase